MTYRHLTNLESPVDDCDGVFLNTLEGYKLGPPIPTPDRDMAELVLRGVMGVYTTEERVMSKEVQSLTGFSNRTLSQVILGEVYQDYEALMVAHGNDKVGDVWR